jgi:hypothetical protein
MVVLVALTLLHGIVRIGPTTPVCRVDVPCYKPAAHVTLTFTQPGKSARVTTDASGRYSVRLAPGRWTIHTRVGVRVGPPAFAVPRVLSTRRDFTIDTGIR